MSSDNTNTNTNNNVIGTISSLLFHSFIIQPLINYIISNERKYTKFYKLIYSISFLIFILYIQIVSIYIYIYMYC